MWLQVELQEWQRLSYSMGATGVCMSQLAALPKGLLAAHRAGGAAPAAELDRSGSPAVHPSRGALLGTGILQTVDRCAVDKRVLMVISSCRVLA